MLQCLWCLLKMLELHLCIREKVMKQKPGRNITQPAVMKDRNYGVE